GRDVTDGAGADYFDGGAQVGVGRSLITHLRGDLVLGGDFAHESRLGDIVRERFLGVAVLADAHGQYAGVCMLMVGRADDHGLDVLLLVKHDAIVVVLRSPGKLLESGSGPAFIDVAQGDYVLRADVVELA